ncbi:MAG: hypothetical protein HY675_06265 [Chloroflexi bacterium]|nr:hypothetical protein [Chloroflexota bacterium]
MRRVRRIIQRQHLSSKILTQFLIRAALRMVGDAEVILIMDSTRCLRWEIFTLGVMIGGRVLPVAWAILPYPWPRGKFTPNAVALVNRALACWPKDRPVHLLADRGFPSLKLFRALDRWRQSLPLHYTIRLRAGDWVRMENRQSVRMADLMSGITTGTWNTYRASYQHRGQAGAPTLLVVGRGVPMYPAHQMGPADQARRRAREERRVVHLLSKGQGRAPKTDTIWALLSTACDRTQAVQRYSLRFSTEGTYRDLKSWGLEAVADHETDIEHLDRLIGLAALGYAIQAVVGAEAGRATEGQARARQQQWTTTDRLSVFWRGRQVIHDRAHDWRSWLSETLEQLAHRLAPEESPTNQFCQSPTPNQTLEAA